uniref:NADH-ubiquinone oxidoreductase chain 4 n=1 Tax=Codonobdella sp. IK-2021 TaxID=2848640 RepID=A0A8F2E6D9_9ANNE|nr:NADH dehydrogenase subunit 4 [Codonobdella sp. B45A]QWT29623.1 NADH dehydrogenase subunit 4 [Codonobdella sp. IK-2021]UTS56332.1 NADH dehydrogenase subunit 4 [Codonobdella sp. B45A]
MLKITLMLVGLFYYGHNSKYWYNQCMFLMLSMLILMSLYSSSASLVMKSYWTMNDNMSSSLTMLTLWVSSMMIIASNKIYMSKSKPKLFTMTIMTLNMVLLLCFNMNSILLFYFMFECSLIPTMMLIMMWGYQPERLKASFYLMLYTITSSLPMLLLFIIMMKTCASSMMIKYMLVVNLNENSLLWLMFLIGFLVKVPMYMAHLWLPKAHVEAPVSGSMVLAAILLKLGGYGMIRLMNLCMWLNKSISYYIVSLSLMGGIITSLICLRQHDLKSMIAYSSVSHMSLMICSLMSSSKFGISGSVMIMIAHGLTSSALFILANMNYDLINSRSVMLSKNILTFIPMMSMWWFIFSIMNMSAPPSINLMSEIIMNTSILKMSFMNMLPIMLIMFFTSAYSLIMYTSLNHGNSNKYMNIYYNMTHMNKTLMLMHSMPVIMLVCKLEFIS